MCLVHSCLSPDLEQQNAPVLYTTKQRHNSNHSFGLWGTEAQYTDPEFTPGKNKSFPVLYSFKPLLDKMQIYEVITQDSQELEKGKNFLPY